VNYFFKSSKGGIWFSSIKKALTNIVNFSTFNFNLFSRKLDTLILTSRLFSVYSLLLNDAIVNKLRYTLNNNLLDTLVSRPAVLRLTNRIMKIFNSQDLYIYFNMQSNFHLKALSKFFRSSAFFIGISETAAFTNYLDIVLPVINENLTTNLLTYRLIVFSKHSAEQEQYNTFLSFFEYYQFDSSTRANL
jgi:hypothetical protein